MKLTNDKLILLTDQDEYGRVQGKGRREKGVREEKHVNKSSESIVTRSCVGREKNRMDHHWNALRKHIAIYVKRKVKINNVSLNRKHELINLC